jgi:hypothetical protein
MPDFSQPGDDGAILDDFAVWRRGITYTVRGEMLSPLPCGQEYRINATVRRRIAKGEAFTAYGDLYQRSTAILNARIAQLTSSVAGEPLHTRVLWHAWWSGSVADKYPAAGDYSVACASVTIELVYPNDGSPRRKGNDAPEPSELMAPGGALTALLSSQNVPVQRFDEAYIDFDFNDPSAASADITLSYGEYMSPIQGLNFEPFVQRAENLAKFHCRLSNGRRHPTKPALEIVRREWFCITDSNLVVVMVYFRA